MPPSPPLPMTLSHHIREKKAQATEVLLASLAAYPCNWAAWQALQHLCSDMDQLATLQLPRHWARDCFMVSVCLELQANADALQRLQVWLVFWHVCARNVCVHVCVCTCVYA